MTRLIGILILFAPLVFGILRAASTGTDLRYFLTAVASTVVAALILRRPVRGPHAPVRLLTALLAATLCNAAVAAAQGARSIPAIAFVAFGFAVCSTLGFSLARYR